MGGNFSSTPPTAQKEFEELITQNPVMIFSTTTCPYCQVAKRTFKEMGTTYGALELNKAENGRDLATELHKISQQKTVPQIFVCGKWIGGCSEMRALQKTGVLQEMLKICCDGDMTCSAR